MAFSLTERQRRWLDALLILATLAAAFVVIGFVQDLFFSFGDIVLVFFLAWLLAFILSPIVSALVRMVPRLPRVAAVVVVYAALLGALVFLTVLVANAIGSSISDFIRNVPQLRDQIPAILAPWQDRLRAIGLGQVDLFAQANASYVHGRIHSGFGGQTDFIVGALHAAHGHAIIALPSWHDASESSNCSNAAS